MARRAAHGPCHCCIGLWAARARGVLKMQQSEDENSVINLMRYVRCASVTALKNGKVTPPGRGLARVCVALQT
jgi:hypothetical protein